jgi:hypothetical protein
VLGLSAKLLGAVSQVLCVVNPALLHAGRIANGRSAFTLPVSRMCHRPAVAQRAGFRFAGEAAFGMGEVVIAP